MANRYYSTAAALTSGMILTGAGFVRTCCACNHFSLPFHPPKTIASFAFISIQSKKSSADQFYAHNDSILKCSQPLFTTKTADSEFSFLLKDKQPQPKEELISQEEINFIGELVQKRSDARTAGDYVTADEIRDEIDAISEGCEDSGIGKFSLPAGYKIEVKDIPRDKGGGSDWSLQPRHKVSNDLVNAANLEDTTENRKTHTNESVLGLAHAALGLASSSSEKGVPIDHMKLNKIVMRAKRRLVTTGEQELRGRKASDAAFWFALAGVTDVQIMCVDESNYLDFSLFDALTFICLKELSRFGQRSRCRPVDIMHMVERIAAAGVKSDLFVTLQKEAALCLEVKNTKEVQDLRRRGVIADLHRGKFELHSERSLLWIWRFSTKQRKQRAFLKSTAKHWDNQSMIDEDLDTDDASPADYKESNVVWEEAFKDPTLPLVVDIGCGMGVSILGLSTMDLDHSEVIDPIIDVDWDRCNFLGADLSRIGINFASSISQRWSLGDNVHFTVAPAEDIMNHIAETYPGEVKLCMIQFPTPFRFNQDAAENAEGKDEELKMSSVTNDGNLQLPMDASSGFMVSKGLIESAYSALKNESGFLLLQSNCEDVAVFMNRLANDLGFDSIKCRKSVFKINDTDGMPQRTQKWIALGGERAEGPVWNSATVLPSARGATETEVACCLNGTPIHRVLLKPL